MKCGMYGPIADQIAREQLELDEGYIIIGAASVIHDFDSGVMSEALEDEEGDWPELINAEEAVAAAERACVNVWLPRNIWLFKLACEGGHEVNGIVVFTDEQAEQVRATFPSWGGKQ